MFAPVSETQAVATVDRAWDLGVRLYDTAQGMEPRLDYSYPAVRSVEHSLERLGLDHVDVLHVHDPDEDNPMGLAASDGG